MKMMLKNGGSKVLEFFLDVTHRKRLLVFIGSAGTYLVAYRGSKLIDSLFISGIEYKVDDYIWFLQKYPQYKAVIVPDLPEIAINHTSIPIAQSLLPGDHVRKFIRKTLATTDISASNVYDVTDSDTGEVWDTTIASLPQHPLATEWISAAASWSKDIAGVYFLSLNTPNIIQELLKSNKAKLQSPLQIFVTITSFSEIRLILRDKNKIMESHYIPYPPDKSLAYVQGIIEQCVSDCVISLKNYIHHTEHRPSLVLLVKPDLAPLLQQSKFDVCETLIYTSSAGRQFSDETLSYLLNKKLKYRAVNDELSSFNTAKWFNALFFKPLWLGLMWIIFIIANGMVKVHSNDIAITALNNKYYSSSEEYRQQRIRYPYIDHFNAVIEFHDAGTFLSIPQEVPFEFVDRFLGALSSNFTLSKVHWELDDNDKQLLIINTKYIMTSSNASIALAALRLEVDGLSKSFADYNIDYKQDSSKILTRVGRVTAPVDFIIRKR